MFESYSNVRWRQLCDENVFIVFLMRALSWNWKRIWMFPFWERGLWQKTSSWLVALNHFEKKWSGNHWKCLETNWAAPNCAEFTRVLDVSRSRAVSGRTQCVVQFAPGHSASCVHLFLGDSKTIAKLSTQLFSAERLKEGAETWKWPHSKLDVVVIASVSQNVDIIMQYQP